MLRAGVDLGGTKIQTVIVDDDDNVLGENRRLTPTVGGPPDVADAIAESVALAVADAKVAVTDIAAIGVGAPGQIDKVAGTVSQAGNLPGWTGIYALGPALTARLDMPAHLANDVQVAVNAEVVLGAGRGYDSLIGVFCGTGVGGGVVIDGQLWLGRGAAGEIGHMVVVPDGKVCMCGRSGCLEAYVGRAAMEAEVRRRVTNGESTVLLDIMERKGRTRLSSGVWAKALAKKDPMAVDMINTAVWALGNGVASAVNLLDIDAVIIGGGLGCRLGQPFVDRVAAAARPHLLQEKHPPAILLAELGDLGGALGAALLAKGEQKPKKRKKGKKKRKG